MEVDFRSSNILIAGLGLIGGSFAKALKASGFDNLYAYDHNEQTLKNAMQEGVIQAGYSEINDNFPAFDLVLCCLSPKFVVPLYNEIAPYIKVDGVFAEVGGIKSVIISDLISAMRPSHQLLSLHPMAGSEKAGYDYSEQNMFSNSVLIIIPNEKAGDAAAKWIKVLGHSIQFETIRELTAQEHDKIIAHVSHIPHVAALAVKSMYVGSGNEQYAGGSYQAITRVADINSELWAGLMIDNREYLLESIEAFKQNILMLEDVIKANDAVALQNLLDDISKR